MNQQRRLTIGFLFKRFGPTMETVAHTPYLEWMNLNPNVLRTNNERIFTSRVSSGVLRTVGIRHQLANLGCPWQNGRIERLLGTLKAKFNQWHVLDGKQFRATLGEFDFWSNRTRPHQNLSWRTPWEVWCGIDPHRRMLKRVVWFEAW